MGFHIGAFLHQVLTLQFISLTLAGYTDRVYICAGEAVQHRCLIPSHRIVVKNGLVWGRNPDSFIPAVNDTGCRKMEDQCTEWCKTSPLLRRIKQGCHGKKQCSFKVPVRHVIENCNEPADWVMVMFKCVPRSVKIRPWTDLNVTFATMPPHESHTPLTENLKEPPLEAVPLPETTDTIRVYHPHSISFDNGSVIQENRPEQSPLPEDGSLDSTETPPPSEGTGRSTNGSSITNAPSTELLWNVPSDLHIELPVVSNITYANNYDSDSTSKSFSDFTSNDYTTSAPKRTTADKNDIEIKTSGAGEGKSSTVLIDRNSATTSPISDPYQDSELAGDNGITSTSEPDVADSNVYNETDLKIARVVAIVCGIFIGVTVITVIAVAICYKFCCVRHRGRNLVISSPEAVRRAEIEAGESTPPLLHSHSILHQSDIISNVSQPPAPTSPSTVSAIASDQDLSLSNSPTVIAAPKAVTSKLYRVETVDLPYTTCTPTLTSSEFQEPSRANLSSRIYSDVASPHSSTRSQLSLN